MRDTPASKREPVASYGMFDVRPRPILWPIYSCMALAQNVRFKCDELIHGASPCNGIAFKLLKKGRADVLAEKDPSFIDVKIDDDRPCSMAGGVQAGDGGRTEPQYFLLTGKLPVDTEPREGDVETEGRAHVLVAALDNLGIEGMHHDITAETEFELCCPFPRGLCGNE